MFKNPFETMGKGELVANFAGSLLLDSKAVSD